MQSKNVTFFFRYDIDGNGKIDRKEMEKIIEAIYDRNKKKKQNIYKFFSINNSIEICYFKWFI